MSSRKCLQLWVLQPYHDYSYLNLQVIEMLVWKWNIAHWNTHLIPEFNGLHHRKSRTPKRSKANNLYQTWFRLWDRGLNYLSRDRYSLTITPGHSPKLSQNARIVLTNASSRSLTTETELDPWRCKRFLRITPELMDPLRATYITLRLVPWGFAFCESNWGPL